MIGLQMDPKQILIAAGILLAVGLGVGAVLWHDAEVRSLRADLEAARAASAQAAERNSQLEIQVRQSAAEVAAANQATAAARAQADCSGQIRRSATRERAKNREVIHAATERIAAAPDLAASVKAENSARADYWRRANELFLRQPPPCTAADGGASAPAVPAPTAP